MPSDNVVRSIEPRNDFIIKLTEFSSCFAEEPNDVALNIFYWKSHSLLLLDGIRKQIILQL